MPRTDEAEVFFYAVYSAIQEIPYGKVTSYGHIARLIGTRIAAFYYTLIRCGNAADLLKHNVHAKSAYVSSIFRQTQQQAFTKTMSHGNASLIPQGKSRPGKLDLGREKLHMH